MHAGWLLLQAAGRPLPGGYGVALLQSVLALVAVCILAWVVLRWSAKAGLGMGRAEHLEVVERLALDARRSVVVVRVGKRMLLLGVGDGASPQLITELEPGEIPRSAAAKVSFLDVLRRKETQAPSSPRPDVSEDASEKPTSEKPASQKDVA